MGAEFTFYDYVNDDDENKIASWLSTRPTRAAIDFNLIIEHLEATPIDGWKEPQVKFMKGPCRGFFELRKKVKREHHRIIGYLEGNHAILVLGGVKVQDVLPPSYEVVCGQASVIRKLIQSDPEKYRKLHEL